MSELPKNADAEQTAALYLAGALADDARAAFEEKLAAGDIDSCQAVDELAAVPAELWRLVTPQAPPAKIREALLARASESLSKPEPPTTGDLPAAPYIQLAADASWKAIGRGARMRVLYLDRKLRRFTALVEVEPGGTYPSHHHGVAEECFVLSGDLRIGSHVLRAGDYQRSPAGSDHAEQATETGCTCLIIGGIEQLREYAGAEQS